MHLIVLPPALGVHKAICFGATPPSRVLILLNGPCYLPSWGVPSSPVNSQSTVQPLVLAGHSALLSEVNGAHGGWKQRRREASGSSQLIAAQGPDPMTPGQDPGGQSNTLTPWVKSGGGVSGLVNKGLVCSESTSRVGLWQADRWGGWCQRPGHRGASGAQKEGGENGMAPFPLFFPTLAFGLRLADNIQSTWLNLNFRQATNHF